MKDLPFSSVYMDTVGTLNTSKGKTKMSKIFKWFAEASNSWDHSGHNDAGDVLNLIGAIFGALGA